MPERWNIRGQPADRLALLGRKAARMLNHKAFVVRLEGSVALAVKQFARLC